MGSYHVKEGSCPPLTSHAPPGGGADASFGPPMLGLVLTYVLRFRGASAWRVVHGRRGRLPRRHRPARRCPTTILVQGGVDHFCLGSGAFQRARRQQIGARRQPHLGLSRRDGARDRGSNNRLGSKFLAQRAPKPAAAHTCHPPSHLASRARLQPLPKFQKIQPKRCQTVPDTRYMYRGVNDVFTAQYVGHHE